MSDSTRDTHVVRVATQADFEDILHLNSQWEHFTSVLDGRALTRLHAQASYHKVVESEGQVVAFLLALREGADYDSPNYRWFNERGGEFLYIDRVIVEQSRHGAGLATLLYDDLFAYARAQGMRRVVCELDAEPPNEASRRFHDKYGFHEVGTQVIAEGKKRVSLRQADVASVMLGT